MNQRILLITLCSLSWTCKPGQVVIIDCRADAECNDDDLCTIDACSNGQCHHEPVPPGLIDECEEVPGPCDEDVDCDDGLFCTGYEFCAEGSCRSSAGPCDRSDGLVRCDEESNRCYQCVGASDCAENQLCEAGLCTGICGGETCRSDNLCDGAHCDGPDTCWHSVVSCELDERCDPATGSCVSSGETCLSQCEITDNACCVLDSPGCIAKPAGHFVNYETALTTWSQQVCDAGEGLTWAVAGVCDDGTQVLRGTRPTELDLYTSFYDASGGFLAFRTDSFTGIDFPAACRGQVYWPVEVECSSFTVTQVLCGGLYAEGDTVYLDPCRSQCEISGCPPQPIENFPDFEATRLQWTDEIECGEDFVSLLVGTCEGGSRFLRYLQGFVIEVRFFGGDDGAFLGLLTQADYTDPICCGETYWPRRLECSTAIVDEVFCNTDIPVGEPFELIRGQESCAP